MMPAAAAPSCSSTAAVARWPARLQGPGLAGAARAPPAVGCATIPGFTHPVREMYLEDVLQATGYMVGKDSRYGLHGGEGGGEGGGM